MVGERRCKCLTWGRLPQAFVFLSIFTILTVQVAVGRSTTKATPKHLPSTAAPELMEATPDVVSFVNVPVGDTYTQTVRLTNRGEGTLQIKKITASSPDFRITGILLPVVVAHGTSESFTIAFRGKAEGLAEGQISILTSSSDAPLVLRVKTSTSTSISTTSSNSTGPSIWGQAARFSWYVTTEHCLSATHPHWRRSAGNFPNSPQQGGRPTCGS